MKLRLATLMVAALCTTSTLSATALIYGTLNITGSVRVSNVAIDWQPNAGTTGVFDVLVPGTLYFSGLATSPATYTGDQVDLLMGTVDPPVNNYLSNLRFIAGGAPAPAPYDSFHVDLAGIILPNAPACTGAEGENTSCTLGVFQLTNLGGGQTLIGWRVAGFFEDTNVTCTSEGGGCTPALGRYSTQLGQTIASIKTTIDGGGSITTSYSGNFESSPIPEPGTLGMLLIGGLLIAGSSVSRKFRR